MITKGVTLISFLLLHLIAVISSLSFPSSLHILIMLSAPTAKVGKTSLIMSLVGEEFPEEVSVSTAIHHHYVFA